MAIAVRVCLQGVSEGTILVSWLISYAAFYAAQALIVSIVLGATIFKATNWGLLFAVFLWFGWSAVTFAYLVSTLFSRARTASTVALVVFLALAFPYYGVAGATASTAGKIGTSICAPTAFSLAIDIMSAYGAFDQHLGDVAAVTPTRNYTLAACIAWLVGDCLAYLLLGWYLDHTFPWRTHGILHPWNFCCTPRYWRCTTRRGSAKATDHQPLLSSGDNQPASMVPPGGNPEDYQPLDPEAAARVRAGQCLSVRDLRKTFKVPDGVKTAVDGVSFDMLAGHITVLLGHNGAGKTTLTSMIASMLPATSGSITAFNEPLVDADGTANRASIGVCPQQDCLFPELTVQEHMELFSELKQLPPETATASGDSLLALLRLADKRTAMSAGLSGGQKRKLCIAVAMLGDPKVRAV